jgi:type IV pilus assembly protein PilA
MRWIRSVNKSRGFTFIELLVVIAIIGILASVVIRNVSGAKAKAQEVKTIASLRSAQQVATYCMDRGNDLNTPDITNPICTGQDNWPAPVGLGWSYTDAGSCTFDGDVSDNTFMYCATDGTTVTACTETGCTQT